MPSSPNALCRFRFGIIPIIYFVVLVASLFWGDETLICFAAETSNSNELGARDLQSIVDEGVLRVAMTRFDLPAFHQMRPDGSMVGLEADLARALALALNIK
jgi:ABC-type amino acid transport substrate-binding protein